MKVHLRINKGIITKAINLPESMVKTEFRVPVPHSADTFKGIDYIRETQELLEPAKIPAMVFRWDRKSKAGQNILMDLVRIDFV